MLHVDEHCLTLDKPLSSLSTCHVGLRLRWQILLSLVKHLDNTYFTRFNNICNYLLLQRVHPQLMRPFHLDEINLSCTYQSSQQNFPTNPTSASLHSFCTSMLITIPRQFRYIRPLIPINGRIPERITC